MAHAKQKRIAVRRRLLGTSVTFSMKWKLLSEVLLRLFDTCGRMFDVRTTTAPPNRPQIAAAKEKLSNLDHLITSRICGSFNLKGPSKTSGDQTVQLKRHLGVF